MAAMVASNVLAENRQAWGNVVLEAGQSPYRHKVFSAFLPVAPVAQGTQAPLPLGPACRASMPGVMVCSFTGKAIARKAPSTRLVDRFLGTVEVPKVLALGDGFKHHQAQLDILVLGLTEARAGAEAKKHQAPLRKQATAASSAAALKRASDELGGARSPSPPKRARPAAVRGVTCTMDSFVSRESKQFTLAEAQTELEASLSRLSYGCVIPFAVPEHVLWRDYTNVCIKLGRFGYSLKADGAVGKVENAVVLPKRKALAGRLLDSTEAGYRERLKEFVFGMGGTNVCGWSITFDKTTRYTKNMINFCPQTPATNGQLNT